MSVARDQLASRVIPKMTLSSASNPLTAPILDLGDSPATRATNRFTVSGNALVTGGAGGLGLAAARGLLEHGCTGLCLCDLENSMISAKSQILQLQKDFSNVRIIKRILDVTQETAVNAAVTEVAEELGSIDVLLCFAGIVSCVHAIDVSASEWRKVLDTNTTGSWLCAQAAARHMIKQGTGGSIVLMASISGHTVCFPQPQVAYNTSKAAILHMGRTLAAEWAQHGIRVNMVSPGYMDTILNEGAGLDDAKREWYAHNAMGRMGDPSELIGPVVLLCSAAGRYMTGADIVIDGGQTLF
ncbi:NAD(P)-binding protein [Fistulina hepatica ATCC 64428]|nr:NAD(P)-binding protein [Fistulina hepatica ATCC 64428]